MIAHLDLVGRVSVALVTISNQYSKNHVQLLTKCLDLFDHLIIKHSDEFHEYFTHDDLFLENL